MVRIPSTSSFGGGTVGVNRSSNLVYLSSSNQLTVVDGVTQTLLTSVTIPGSVLSNRLFINGTTNRVYLATTNALLAVVDGDRLSPTFNSVIASVPLGGSANPIVGDEGSNTIVVVLQNEKKTQIINGATNAVSATIPSTQHPTAAAVDPITHRAYIANQLNFVQKINLNTASLEGMIITAAEVGIGALNPNNHLFYAPVTTDVTVMRTLDKNGVVGQISALPHASGRYTFAAVNRQTNRIYALNTMADIGGTASDPCFVSVIDGDTDTVIANVTVGNQPFGIGANEATNKVYVTNAGRGVAAPGGISIVDGASNTAESANTSAFTTQSFQGPVVANEVTNKIYFNNASAALGVLDGITKIATPFPTPIGAPFSISVNKVLNRVYVAASNGLNVINGDTDAVITTINLTSTGGIAINEITHRIFVTNPSNDTLTIIDGASNAVVDVIPVGDNPTIVAVNDLTNRIYLGNRDQRTVSVIDGSNLTVVATVPVSLQPRLLSVDRVFPDSTCQPRMVLTYQASSSSQIKPASLSATLTTVDRVRFGKRCWRQTPTLGRPTLFSSRVPAT